MNRLVVQFDIGGSIGKRFEFSYDALDNSLLAHVFVVVTAN